MASLLDINSGNCTLPGSVYLDLIPLNIHAGNLCSSESLKDDLQKEGILALNSVEALRSHSDSCLGISQGFDMLDL